MRILLSVGVLLAIYVSLSEARATRKHIEKGSKKDVLSWLDMTRERKCHDHPYCARYTIYDCTGQFVRNNCLKMCGRCGTKKLKLPAVLYYNKGKHGAKKRVARHVPPTVSQTLFDYVSNHQHFGFNYPTKPAVWYDFKNPPPFLKTNDQTAAQQSNDVNKAYDQTATQQAAAPAPAQAAQAPAYNTQASAYNTQANAYNAQAAPPANQAADQPTVNTYPVQASNDNTLNVKLPASALQQAKQSKDVYVAVYDKPTADQATAQAQNDQPQDQNKQGDFKPMPTINPCLDGRCPEGLTKAPEVKHPFMVYCDDKFPSCGVLHSACNDSWLQIYCPKRCNLCKPDDQQQDKPQSAANNKIYPTEIKAMDTPKLESQLIAPAPGEKAQKAKYTLHVKPKLLNGVPQPQEIAIMPPDSTPGSDVKPLVILKQTVTKPMVEYIEIDVPKKGTSYSKEPKVEVIEGNNKEILSVTKGEADLSSAEAALEAENQKTAAADNTQAKASQAFNAQQGQATWDATQQTQPTQADVAQQTQATQVDANQQIQPNQADATQAAQAQPEQTAQATQQDQTQAAQTYQNTEAQAAPTQATAADQTQATQAYAQTQATPTQAQTAQAYQAPAAQAYQDNPAQTQPQPTQATPTQNSQAYQNYQTQASQTQADQTQATQTQSAYNPYARTDVAKPADAAAQCTDDSRCASYSNVASSMCKQNWLINNCKKMCNQCS